MRGIVDYYLDEFKCGVEELQNHFHNSDVKNPIGYTGVNSNGIHSGFVSREVVRLQRKHNCSVKKLTDMKLLTGEHVFGTTLIGRMALQAFIDSKFNRAELLCPFLCAHVSCPCMRCLKMVFKPTAWRF